VLPPGASSGMSDILLRTSCCKISLPLRNAPGGNTDSGPDTRIYLRIYKFVNFFEKSACTVLES
ncbi:hypothetical protein, partial [Collinsella aerofaciens]|uniref:hypothetical protein n=1 Tax=Collinsella aerofaciens TaxID=74426 RepID=UPI0034A340D6